MKPFTAPTPTSRIETDPCPTGSHPARCVWLIDLGTHREQFKDDEPKDVRKIAIGFEFPTETSIFREEDGPQPYLLTKRFTRSMHEKASLRKFLSTWRGEVITDAEASTFDISKLVGAQALVSVSHDNRKPERTYANIDAAMRMPKGYTCPPQVNPTRIVDLNNLGEPETHAAITTLPKWLKEAIETSYEFLAFERRAKGAPGDDSDAAWAAVVKDEEPAERPF